MLTNINSQSELPLVSVVIASYNHAQYIEQTLSSVFAQDYPRLQVLVFDDGSNDGSVELLQKLQQRWGFELILQANKGLVTTLNLALARVSGKYLCELGSDDIWLPHDKLKQQVIFMEANPNYGLVCGQYLPIDAQGQTTPGKYKLSSELEITFEMELAGNQIILPTVMLRTEAVRQVGGWDEDIWLEDYPLWLKLAQAGWQMKRLARLMACHRWHGANASARVRRMVKAEVVSLKRYAPAVKLDAILAHYYQSQIEKHWRQDPLLIWYCLAQLGSERFSKNLRRLYLHWLKKAQWKLFYWGIFGVPYRNFNDMIED